MSTKILPASSGSKSSNDMELVDLDRMSSPSSKSNPESPKNKGNFDWGLARKKSERSKRSRGKSFSRPPTHLDKLSSNEDDDEQDEDALIQRTGKDNSSELKTEEFASHMLDATNINNIVPKKKSNADNIQDDNNWNDHIEDLKHQIATLRENPESEKIWGQAIESRWKAKREAAAAKEAVVAMNTQKHSVHIKSHQLKASKSLVTKTVMKPFNGHGRRSSVVSDHKKVRMQRVKSQLEQKKGRSKLRQGSTGALIVDADVLRLAIRRDKCHRLNNCCEKLRDWRIYPNSTVETIWILFTTFFVFWTSLMLPVTVAFIEAKNRPLWWQIIDVSADVFYVTDVVLNFRAVYLDTWGAMITESPKIAQHYMFGASGTSIGWFWIDFPASIPWNLFIDDNIGIRNAGYMFNLPKLARLFHLPAQVSKLPCMKQGANSGRITKLFTLFIMVAHWFGCLWYLVGSLEEAKTSCIKYQGGNSDGACSWIDASDVGHLPKKHLYVRSLYWAITTMTSVGYGDISPINQSETIVGSIIMLIGSAMYATIFSNMASYIQSIDADFSNFQQKMNDVRQQMTYLRIPDELSEHIEMYYNYMWTCHKGLVEHQQYFYKDLPPALNLEISMHLFHDTVGGVALFKGCSASFLREVVLCLQPQVCIPGEYIVNKNDVARAMFFVTRGEVEVLDNFEGKHLAFLRAPQYFGETAILEARRRTASIQALTYADLYYLLASSMQVILKSFKVDDERIHMNALQFLNHGSKKKEGSKARSTYAYMNKKDLQKKKDKLLQRIKSHQGIEKHNEKVMSRVNSFGVEKANGKDSGKKISSIQEEEEEEEEERLSDSAVNGSKDKREQHRGERRKQKIFKEKKKVDEERSPVEISDTGIQRHSSVHAMKMRNEK